MRIALFITAFFWVTLISCNKEDEWQTVTITGNYTNTPDVSGGFHSVPLPNGTVLQAPKKYIVDGTDNIVGAIDESKSFLQVKTVTINPITGAFDLTFSITIFDSVGDKVEFEGTGQSYANATGLSWQHYTGGTGKYDAISGWVNTSIATNPATGIHTISVTEGEATYKK